MKICYLCADLGIPVAGHKGASAHVRGLVRAFTELGHEVLLVSPRADGAEDLGVPLGKVRVPGITDAALALDNVRVARALGHVWNNAAVEEALMKALSSGAHVLYERYSPFALAGALVSRTLGIPHVLEVNAPLAWEGEQFRKQALLEAAAFAEKAAFDSACRIIAVSRELREALVAQGVAADKVIVVPNGVDADLFAPNGDARREGLDGKVVVGFVGGLRPWHGIEMLADAFRALAPDPRFHLLVVGAGPLSKAVQALSQELPGRVTHVGAVPQAEVPALVRAMDIAVAPYPRLDRFYYSPLKVLEYLSAGRAVVATRIGQLTELVRHGETGLLVEPGDASGLAGAVKTLADDESLRRGLGARAAEEIRLAHSWRHRAAVIIREIEEAIA